MDKKFSTLLRLGASQVKHNVGTYLDSTNCYKVEEACAIGLMAVGRSGALDYPSCRVALAEVLNGLEAIDDGCLKAQIINWNDQRLLSAEQIAVRLEELGY